MRNRADKDKKKQFSIDNLSSLERLVRECDSMIHYALRSGMAIPPESVRLINTYLEKDLSDINKLMSYKPRDIREITTIHYKLAQTVAPAKPGTLLLLSVERKRNDFLTFLGPIPFIRRMLVVAFIFFLVFIRLCLTSEVNAENISKDIFSFQGTELLIVLLFYVIAAGLGASFAALFEANKYVVKGTFEPMYESSYWIRFILGMMSGLLLSSLIPLNILTDVSSGSIENSFITPEGLNAFIKPLLAMLGGFSAALLYRILSRLVESVESIISGSPVSKIEMKKEVLQSQIEQEKYKNIMSLNAKLSRLQLEIKEGINPSELQQKVNSISQELMPFGIDDEARDQLRQHLESGKTINSADILEYCLEEIDTSPVKRESEPGLIEEIEETE